MTPHEFIAKWRRSNLSERSACQQHFCDLCDLLGRPKPAEADPDGAWYTFERGVRKTAGGQGWADVWMRGHFGWEYKGKHKDLVEAYQQLLLYREDLENPPLLVVCDMDRFEVHTNFTGTAKRVYAFDLSVLDKPANLDVLQKLFAEPEALRPDVTAEKITREAAERFADLAKRLQMRKDVPAQRAAHFLMKLMFCMFGEKIGLLPPKLFAKLLESGQRNPAVLTRHLEGLFAAMCKGGDFGADEILWFNGGLFSDADVVPLETEEVNILAAVNEYDWGNVEPSIFGTLFERTLDPDKRSQIGAHYTGRQDIETLVKPVVMAPLRREWDEVKRRCEEQLWPKVEKAARKGTTKDPLGGKASAPRRAFDRALLDFVERLAHVTVLDPACGSGNFLYVAIHLLLDLEKEVIAYAASHGLTLIPHVRPTQVAGLEINPYAQQLAQVVIWIGYLQWMKHNGFKMPSHPVLEPIETIRCADAILDLTDPKNPKEPEWPKAEFIVSNPPFLGDKMMRGQLGDKYVDDLRGLYEGRVPGGADLCCYWFEKARTQIQRGKCERAGLLATQGIRGGANRAVLKSIKETGDIFFAISDREWTLPGATVHISMVGFDDGSDRERILDGHIVAAVNPNLTPIGTDISRARQITRTEGLAFMGSTKKAPLDIPLEKALSMFGSSNPHGKPNSDVIVPYLNALDVTRRNHDMFLIDFPVELSLEDASRYEEPFEYVKEHVLPLRINHREAVQKQYWWRQARPCPDLKRAVAGLPRFCVTPAVSKHRLFVWQLPPVLPDHALYVFATSDDVFFGVLQSRVHEIWGLALGTRLETRPRYTPSTCFETFPFPEPTAEQSAAIAAAAKELDDLRNRWLNPPEWTTTEVLEFPGSLDGPWARYIQGSGVRGQGPGIGGQGSGVGEQGPAGPHPGPLPEGEGTVGTVRWPRIVPKDAECAESLKKRTLTNLYNQRPAWLDLAHKKLDAAVFAAYAWDPGISDEALLEKLLALNLERSARPYPDGH